MGKRKKTNVQGTAGFVRGGLIGVRPKMPVRDNYALSLVYTPGVAEPCKEIQRDPAMSYRYTWRRKAVALIGEGVATLPRLEAAAAAMKQTVGLDGVPLAVSGGAETLAAVVRRIALTFGAAWLFGVSRETAKQVLKLTAGLEIPVIRPPRSAATGRRPHCPHLMRTFARTMEKACGGRTPASAEAADWLKGSNQREQALRLHGGLRGTLEMEPRVTLDRPGDWAGLHAAARSAGKEIERSPRLADELTGRSNMVAVVTDGTAVLGLGDIGAGAGLPVMLGKCVLFKTFGGCEAVPICVNTREPSEVVETVEALEPSFGGINLEDISAPRCFGIEEELKRRLDIFVFHDDQHGTAVVTLAGLLNAAKLCGKELSDLTVTFNGAGAAGVAVTRLLMAAGVRDVILCDRAGAIYEGRGDNMNPMKEEIARRTNRGRVKGSLADAVRGRDVFIGLSAAGVLTGGMVRTMSRGAIVFAMANPVPEIMPDEALAAGAAAVATGRSDFANQINNCLGFPGIFRGALDVRARSVNDAMKIAAARAIAELVPESALRPEYFIPGAVDLRVPPAVAEAIARAAIESGAARRRMDPARVGLRMKRFLYEGRLERGEKED